MTIDEMIKHHIDMAKMQESRIEKWEKNRDADAEKFHKRLAADHRQLAEWLTELKQWRRVYGVCPSYEMCIPECKEGYNDQIAEYKRLLKMAVEDLSKMPCNNDTHRPESCYICEKHGNCSYADSFKWCKADIALKLIGEEDGKI